MQALYQLSYSPKGSECISRSRLSLARYPV